MSDDLVEMELTGAGKAWAEDVIHACAPDDDGDVGEWLDGDVPEIVEVVNPPGTYRTDSLEADESLMLQPLLREMVLDGMREWLALDDDTDPSLGIVQSLGALCHGIPLKVTLGPGEVVDGNVMDVDGEIVHGPDGDPEFEITIRVEVPLRFPVRFDA